MISIGHTGRIFNPQKQLSKFVLLIIPILIVCVSCENKFNKKIRQAVEYANANLPNQINDWMWKDSVSYNPQERTLYHYFSFHVDESKRILFRKMLMNDQLGRNLLLTEDVSIYIENKISMGVVSTFEDGEVISKIIISPEEMKAVSTQGVSYKDLTEYIYSNMAISLSAICPYRIDRCTSITQADFNRNEMEFVIYWEIDDDCMPLLEEQVIRETMKDYIIELVQYNRNNIFELEKHTKLSTYKRSDFPIKITLVCRSNNGFSISESMLTSDVTI